MPDRMREDPLLLNPNKPSPMTSRFLRELVRDAGFEPASTPCNCKASAGGYTQIDAHAFPSCPELGEILAVWPSLPPALKAAVLAVVRSHQGTA